MNLHLYNTFSRKKELFSPLNPPTVTLYSCGPTVYDYDHIGHAWKYTVDDVLRRVLEYNGYKVKHALNITDVGHLVSDADEGEDKVEKASRKEGKDAWELTKYYTDVFFENRKLLNQLEPTVAPRATDHIPEMIKLVKILEEKNMTYKTSDGIYFDISKFPNYGKLSGNTLDKLKAGARVKVNPEKKHPADFALWKFSPALDSKRQMEWDSPWGVGFPGWHIECSAMSMKYLGETLDIHTGGEDNIFPHHESEIAQSETASGKQFSRWWVHTRFLQVDGAKMSKSKNNFYRIQDLIKRGFDPLAFRYLCLTAHYRTPLDFTWESLEAAQRALKKLQRFTTGSSNSEDVDKKLVGEYANQLLEAVNDDLNTPKMLATVWELINSTINNSVKRASVRKVILDFDKVLGLDLTKAPVVQENNIPSEVLKLVEERTKLRNKGAFEKADRVRDKIKELGFVVEDTSGGSRVLSLGDSN